MNNLFATWQQQSEVDLGPELDALELLSRAHDHLVLVPELAKALRLVDGALDQVAAWTAQQGAPRTIVLDAVPVCR
jgi:hypothetical protein